MEFLAREKIILLFTITLIICGVSNGEVYKVGDSSGWIAIGRPDYKSWAASKNFHVGDVIVFEYNKQYHSVLRVTHRNFNTCNITAPHSYWATGNDSFTIRRPGHFYFVCGAPGHCQAGQKVDIRVTKAQVPPKAPSPFSSVAPSSGPISASPMDPAASGPSPTHQKNGSSSLISSWKLWGLGLGAVLKAIVH